MAEKSAFVKQLVAQDPETRDKALETLGKYLQSRKSFEDLELMKLWKGLFYSMWLADKPIPQQRLAASLASIPTILPEANVLPFLSAFWRTIAREWSGIDVLRMDKFLLLVRLYVRVSFELLAKKGWREEKVDEMLEVFEATPLNLGRRDLPDGLRMHVVDVWVDELDRVDSGREGNFPLEKMMAPVKKLGEETVSPGVKKTVESALEDERLVDWDNPPADSEEEHSEDGPNEQLERENERSMSRDNAALEEDLNAEWNGFDD
ncbi:Nop52-domain-containing protein [Aulographum hederae CBS 113979]|uniref:Nop52-domain-containing protein n=1 Tax=Aulographum hederae CBS 113979 TaxID=1176131 RepID=A0A6G1GK38_9PEZI|nr:Nop52-domain-containing protein [Aulographum hederae CBS 113979]